MAGLTFTGAIRLAGSVSLSGDGPPAPVEIVVPTNYFIGTLRYPGKDLQGNAIHVRGSSVYVAIQHGYSTTGGSTVARLDTDMSTVIWERDLTGGTEVRISDVKADSAGNVYAVGFADNTVNASNNAVIVKYNSSGTLQWQRQLGTDTSSIWDDQFYKLVIDSSDNIYVSGWEATSSTATDALVVKYDSSGTVLWRRRLGLSAGSSEEWAYGIALDGSNNVYINGGNKYPSNTLGFLAKYDSSGTAIWQSYKLGVNSHSFTGIVVDSSGNSYSCGHTTSNFFLQKHNSSGTLVWGRDLAEGSRTIPWGIVQDSQGYIYVCIESSQSSLPGASSVEYTLVLLKYDTSGTVIWQRVLRPAISDTAYDLVPGGMVLDGSDNIYITGKITGADFDDALLIKIPSDGSSTGTYFLNNLQLSYTASSLTPTTRSISTGTLALIDSASTCTETVGTLTDSVSTATINAVNVVTSSTAYFAGRLTSAGTGAWGGIDGFNNTYVSSYSADQTTMYLAKYNSVGAIQWQKSLTKSGAIFTITKMVVDKSGNSYIVGYTDTSGMQCIVVKVDNSGTAQWQKTLGAPGEVAVGTGVAVDQSGNVHIVGYTGGVNPNMVLAKYNSAGTIQWQRTLTGASSDYGNDVGVDSVSNVYVVGYTNSVGYGSNDIYLVKYNSLGTLQWQTGIGSATAETGIAIDVDDVGNCYAVGSYTTGAFTAKWNASVTQPGSPTWVRRVVNANGVVFNDVAVDPGGNVYAVGYTNSEISASDRNMFIVKYDSAGTVLWQRDLGYFVNGSSQDYGKSVAVDGIGNLCIFGYSNANSTNDVLFAKVPSDGSGIGSYTIGSTSYIYNTNGLDYATTTFTGTARTLTTATSTFTDATIVLTSAVSALASTTASWTATTSSLPSTQRAIFGYGFTTAAVSMTNLVGNTGVVATDTTGVGTARYYIAAAGYGGDKAVFVNGTTAGTAGVTTGNLVSNGGIVASNSTLSGSGRWGTAGATYGYDKAVFGFGQSGTTTYSSRIELISNTGVYSIGQASSVGTARSRLAAVTYGGDKVLFGYGTNASGVQSMTNLVSNTGVTAADVTGVGTARSNLAATKYGTDKAIFGYGNSGSVTAVTNLVSNTGVVATDTTGVGTAREYLAAASYGSDKAIFGYGTTGAVTAITNLVSNTGVVATDTTGVGTARYGLAAAGFSFT